MERRSGAATGCPGALSSAAVAAPLTPLRRGPAEAGPASALVRGSDKPIPHGRLPGPSCTLASRAVTPSPPPASRPPGSLSPRRSSARLKSCGPAAAFSSRRPGSASTAPTDGQGHVPALHHQALAARPRRLLGEQRRQDIERVRPGGRRQFLAPACRRRGQHVHQADQLLRLLPGRDVAGPQRAMNGLPAARPRTGALEAAQGAVAPARPLVSSPDPSWRASSITPAVVQRHQRVVGESVRCSASRSPITVELVLDDLAVADGCWQMACDLVM